MFLELQARVEQARTRADQAEERRQQAEERRRQAEQVLADYTQNCTVEDCRADLNTLLPQRVSQESRSGCL